MFIATVVIAIVFALMLVFSGVGKLRHDPKQMGVMTEVGFPQDLSLIHISEPTRLSLVSRMPSSA